MTRDELLRMANVEEHLLNNLAQARELRRLAHMAYCAPVVVSGRGLIVTEDDYAQETDGNVDASAGTIAGAARGGGRLLAVA